MSEETENSQSPEETEGMQTDGESGGTDAGGVDQFSLADEWEKMAEAGEINVDADEEASEKEIHEEEGIDAGQQAMIDEWEQMASAAPAPETPEAVIQPVYGGVDFTTLMDIPLEVSVEVGNASMRIEELLHLTPNSVIELDKFISEPVDIRVNGRLIAQGELYTVDDNFAIKITAIMTPQDRMKLVDEQPW